eukprot:7284679-Pyramimonas_sp.AAC.1
MKGMRWLGRLMKQRSIVDSFLLASDLCVVEGVAISMASRNRLRQKTGWHWYRCEAVVSESTS